MLHFGSLEGFNVFIRGYFSFLEFFLDLGALFVEFVGLLTHSLNKLCHLTIGLLLLLTMLLHQFLQFLLLALELLNQLLIGLLNLFDLLALLNAGGGQLVGNVLGFGLELLEVEILGRGEPVVFEIGLIFLHVLDFGESEKG